MPYALSRIAAHSYLTEARFHIDDFSQENRNGDAGGAARGGHARARAGTTGTLDTDHTPDRKTCLSHPGRAGTALRNG